MYRVFARAAVMAALVGAPIVTHAQGARQPVVLSKEGLDLRNAESGAVDTVGFNTDQDVVVEAIAGALGDPTNAELNSDCGAGPLQVVDFKGGLRLYFKAGQFAGWEVVDGGGYSTANGIRIGMTQKALQAASQEMAGEKSTLGYEFTADGLSGLLSNGSPAGRITTLWAGTTCTFR